MAGARDSDLDDGVRGRRFCPCAVLGTLTIAVHRSNVSSLPNHNSGLKPVTKSSPESGSLIIDRALSLLGLRD